MKLLFTPFSIVAGLVAGMRGAADHSSRHGFAKLTGSWPGDEAPEPE